MPSTSESSTGGPINNLPYDVLREIFILCLPRYPLKHRQPDTTIAPMLLCQVCSSWRMVALTSVTLWSHLLYCFTIKNDDDSQDWAFFEDEIEFIRWWRRNQGSMAPFISLSVDVRWDRTDQQRRLAGDETKFVLDYLTSAQYLKLNTDYWSLIRKRIKTGYQFLCPNLCTLVHNDLGWDPTNDTFSFYRVQALLGNEPNRPPSTLLHLAIVHEMLPYNIVPVIPAHWSALTHISLNSVEIPFGFWLSFIRAVPDLQWGYFHFEELDTTNGYTTPAEWSLLHLSTLFLIIDEVANQFETDNQDLIDFPLSLLFANLHLPALHTLSLYSSQSPWLDNRAIEELYTILRSTPAITTLDLRGSFFSLGQDRYADLLELTGESGDIKPVWRPATRLAHLHLELPGVGGNDDRSTAAAARLDRFIRNAFCDSSKWLGLDNSACPIQTITLVDKLSRGALFERVKTYTMSSIQKYVQAPNVTFHVTLDSPSRTASRLWMEWGSRA